MTSYALAERHALADLLAEIGPEAPTLCEGWNTADLAAHLVIRERRPDAGLGLVLPVLSGWTKKVRHQAGFLADSLALAGAESTGGRNDLCVGL